MASYTRTVDLKSIYASLLNQQQEIEDPAANLA